MRTGGIQTLVGKDRFDVISADSTCSPIENAYDTDPLGEE
jgi:hypothetical protein